MNDAQYVREEMPNRYTDTDKVWYTEIIVLCTAAALADQTVSYWPKKHYDNASVGCIRDNLNVINKLYHQGFSVKSILQDCPTLMIIWSDSCIRKHDGDARKLQMLTPSLTAAMNVLAKEEAGERLYDEVLSDCITQAQTGAEYAKFSVRVLAIQCNVAGEHIDQSIRYMVSKLFVNGFIVTPKIIRTNPKYNSVFTVSWK